MFRAGALRVISSRDRMRIDQWLSFSQQSDLHVKRCKLTLRADQVTFTERIAIEDMLPSIIICKSVKMESVDNCTLYLT
jgi:hypothetical protein